MFPDPKVLTKVRERHQPCLDTFKLSSKAGLLDWLEAGHEPSYMEHLRRINRLRTYIGSFWPMCLLYDTVFQRAFAIAHHTDKQGHLLGPIHFIKQVSTSSSRNNHVISGMLILTIFSFLTCPICR